MEWDDKESNHIIMCSNQQNDGSSVLDSFGYHLVTKIKHSSFLAILIIASAIAKPALEVMKPTMNLLHEHRNPK